MVEGSYFSNDPELSLAILTEKCTDFGYFYVYKSNKKLELEERDPWTVPIAIWFNEPVYNYEELTKIGENADDKIIAQSSNPYFEFIYKKDLNFQLISIHKIDVNEVRNVVEKYLSKESLNFRRDKFLALETERKIVNKLIPNLIITDLRGY